MQTETIRELPLSALRMPETSVRTAPESEQAMRELKASIAAHGLLGNLLVRAAADGGPARYDVVAGTRRLRAMRELADERLLHPDTRVLCRILDEETNDTEISLAENEVRAAMHPVDQAAAFRQLAGEGVPAAEIAARFGISEHTVARRLRLAGIHPEILEAARRGRLTAEHLAAFAATADQTRQLALWNRIGGSEPVPAPRWIRGELTAGSVPASTCAARFVGLDAYLEAGGRVEHDLFSRDDDERTMLIDPDVLGRLAAGLLEQEAERRLADGWKWARAYTEISSFTLDTHGRVRGAPLGPDPGQQAEIARIDTRVAEIEARLEEYNTGADDALELPADHPAWPLAEEHDGLLSRRREIEEEAGERMAFTPEQKACAGCIATIEDGRLKVHEGLVRPEDAAEVPRPRRSPEPAAGDAAPATAAAAGRPAPPPESGSYHPPVYLQPGTTANRAVRAAGLTSGLADELRLTRGALVKAHLADDFEAAFDLTAYQLAAAVFGVRSHEREPLALTAAATADRPAGTPGDRAAFEQASPGIGLLARSRARLPLGWLEIEDREQRFTAFRALPAEDRRRLFAAAVARTLHPQLSFDEEARPEVEATIERLGIPFAAAWRPDVGRFWSRMRKSAMLAVARRTLGPEWASAHAGDRKDELAAAMGAAFGREGTAEGLKLTPAARAAALAWAPAGFGAFEASEPDDAAGEATGTGSEARPAAEARAS